MTTPTKPAIVIIHGGWHVPASYAKLRTALRAAGYEVHVPRLPSTHAARPPTADLATDTSFIRSYVEGLVEAGRTVVAVMHSYGGQVGTGALHGLGVPCGGGGGVSLLVYVCAFAMPEGKSMVDKVREFGHEDLLPLAFDFADDDSCVHRDPRTLLVGGGAEEEEMGEKEEETDAYVATFVRWNGRCMYQGIAGPCAWREIPAAYVYTAADMTVPLDYQKSMVAAMEAEGREVRTVELPTGHCPNFTAPKGIVDAINSWVEGQG